MSKNEIKNYSRLIAGISLALSICLILIYIHWGPINTNPLLQLFLNTIPSALVVLISFPILYWLFISKGVRILSLTSNDQGLNSKGESESTEASRALKIENTLHVTNYTDAEPMRKNENEVKKITNRVNHIKMPFRENANNPQKSKDVLVIVDVQNDFFEGGTLPVPNATSLLKPLNASIERAEQAGVIIIYTQDWHPPNHKSFKGSGGQWNPHCIQGEKGAKLHPDLREATASEIIKFGLDSDLDGYSPFENQAMVEFILRPDVGEIFVVGIATEFCVLATCIEAQKYKKKVTVIESLIRAAEPAKLDDTWKTYDEYRVRRVKTPPW